VTLRRPAMLTLFVACLTALAAGSVGCSAMPDERRATFGIQFPPPAANEQPSAIVFMMDGVNARVFTEMLDAGRLPNFKKYFVDRGLFFNRCTVNVPSITLANQTSLVTGLFTGHHGVPGNKWFDRNRLVFRDYEDFQQKNLPDDDFSALTIFERLPDRTTASLFHQVHRGASFFTENRLSAAAPYGFGLYDLVDRISLWRFDVVAEVAREQGKFPGLVWCYMLAPDMYGYDHGVSSDEYRWALEHDDAHVGRIMRDLEAAGRLDKTYLVLVSDHGMMDVTRHWSIREFLSKELGLTVTKPQPPYESTPFEERLAYYQAFSGVLAVSGDRSAGVYLRKPGGSPASAHNWLARPTAEELRHYPAGDDRQVDLIERLVRSEAVDVVAYRTGPDRVRVATQRGEVEIQTRRGQYLLRAVTGDDALGYREKVSQGMLNGSYHDAAEWLATTADTDYPDLVPQVACYFESERAGDLLVFAAPGWDFGKTLRAGHGGLAPEEMYTILLMAGPGIPHEHPSTPVHSVDVTPTVLELLGHPIPTGLDGRSVLNK
jgi:hypothetical protein